MRRASRIDVNQPEVVLALRKLGCSVEPIHMLGRGIPDLLVGHRGTNLLCELKDGKKPPSARRLTDDEEEWHQLWRGQVSIINSVDEAIEMIARHGNWILPPHRSVP